MRSLQGRADQADKDRKAVLVDALKSIADLAALHQDLAKDVNSRSEQLDSQLQEKKNADEWQTALAHLNETLGNCEGALNEGTIDGLQRYAYFMYSSITTHSCITN